MKFSQHHPSPLSKLPMSESEVPLLALLSLMNLDRTSTPAAFLGLKNFP